MNTIITIGRQFGSGGREIGEDLAKKYGIPYYDRDLITRVSKESGLCEEMIESNDERPTSSFLYNLVMDTYSFGYNSASFSDMPLSHKVFLAQFDTIKNVAKEGPCVIVGRCADYALESRNDVVNIFIHAGEETRIKRIMARHSVEEKAAKDMMNKADKKRQSYYNYYTGKKWGRADTYHLSVDSGVLGIQGTVNLISQFVDDYERRTEG
ncbi:MAG: cytidylate kinase-like family protein [Lachnospiraceae bacterium]|nr:cytidylate kinase-like family protein [Lachnospiraceae bacterium]